MAKKKHPKAPKAPKASASASSHEKYHIRYNDWVKECNIIDKQNAEQERLAKKTADLKSGPTGKKRR